MAGLKSTFLVVVNFIVYIARTSDSKWFAKVGYFSTQQKKNYEFPA